VTDLLLFFDLEQEPAVDPLDPANCLIFATGPVAGSTNWGLVPMTTVLQGRHAGLELG